MEKVFIIPGNTPSSKNGKIKTRWGMTDSKPVKEWKKNTKGSWKDQKDEFKRFVAGLPAPIFIHLVFIKKTEVLFDYFGPGETIADAMVEHGWINDDNVYQLVPVFGKFRTDKNNPGCEIRVLSKRPKYEFL